MNINKMNTKLCEKYNDLVKYCGSNDEAYDMVKEHYCDVCSNGDVYINAIIDNIYNNIDSNNMVTNDDDKSTFTYYYHTLTFTSNNGHEVPKICKEEFDGYCEYICDTIDYFLQGGEPNPFWAS